MRTELFLKTQVEVLGEIEARLTDTGNTLATDAQYYAGISEGVRMWGKRVVVPKLYTLPSGFSSGTYDYTLPSYIHPPIRVQIRTPIYTPYGIVNDGDDTATWQEIAGYDIEPNDSGGFSLRLQVYPYSEDGRILYWAENGPVPATVPTLTGNITSAATSIALTVTSGPDLHQSGYFKIENEWISYSDLTRTSSTAYTATGCLRGLYGTTAASHNSATSAPWGIAVDDQRLWVQLWDYVTAYAHALQMHKSTTEDMSRHEKLMSFYQQKADNFWRQTGYVSQRQPRFNVKAKGIGQYLW